MHLALIFACETINSSQNNNQKIKDTYIIHIYHEEFIIHRDALVYNNGKSIVSTLTSSVRANFKVDGRGEKDQQV